MRGLTGLGKLGLLIALALLVGAPVGLLGQDEGEGQANLTLKDVKQRLKENKKHLKEAKNRGKAGDAAGMEVALENYERGFEGLNRAMNEGRFEGDVFEREEAFERVERATRKHTEVLSNLLDKVPEQARPAIEHAMEVSQRGRSTALQNLERARTQRQAAQRERGFGGPQGSGYPGSVGQPGGVGGPPTGVGRPGGVGGGRPGGGPPSGRPGGPR